MSTGVKFAVTVTTRGRRGTLARVLIGSNGRNWLSMPVVWELVAPGLMKPMTYGILNIGDILEVPRVEASG